MTQPPGGPRPRVEAGVSRWSTREAALTNLLYAPG